ncbi:MAG: RNA polymerase sigma-70 factor [Bacteroidota bacterium]
MSNTFQIGDLERLFKQYQPVLLTFANRFVRSPEDAREIVQDVFVAVWNNRSAMRLDGNLKSYLFTATRNKCLNFLQKRKLQTTSLDANPLSEGSAAFEQAANNIEGKLEAAELLETILDEVALLPKKCQQVFVLSRQEGLSYKEIAQQMDISVKTVENQIGIALKRIRKRVYGSTEKGSLRSLMLCLFC